MALTMPKASQINFDLTNISDPIIRLNSGESGSADKDTGIVLERGSDTNVAIIYDESADTFAVINTSEDGTTSGNVSISSYAPVKLSNLIIADAGNIGSASDTDAIAISSGGVVTMNQIPVFSAGINVSGGTIAGTLATAAQGNVTSLGTLTTLTVDNIIINGANIGHTSDTDSIAIASDGVVTFSQAPVFPDGSIAVADLDIDGGTDIGAGLADADLLIVDDGAGGTNRKTAMSRVKTYVADVTLTTAAQTNITSLGTLTTLTVDNIVVNGTNIGHTSDTDAIAIASDGVVTMNQIPVFSAGINVSGGTIAGTLATAAQGNVTSLGTLTTLTVDNIIINGTNIGHTSDTDAIAIASDGVVTFSQTPVFSSDITLTDDLYLDSDGSVIHFGDDGEVTLTHVHNQGLRMEDSDKLTFGAGDDMQLYHDGSNSYIDDGGDGSIFIRSGTTYIQNAAGSKTSIATNAGAGQDIYHNNTVKLTTTANGITVSGGIIIADAGNIGSASDTDAMAIASGGAVTFSQRDVHSAGITIADAGQIGSASDADAIAIASNGVVTFTQAPVFPDGSIAIADLDIDGGTDIGEALADADLLIVDNGAGGTNRKVAMSRVKTYVGGGALDDISAGDAASTLATTAGNITIDAQGNNTDIIFKGTDATADITMLTLSGANAGDATFNNDIYVDKIRRATDSSTTTKILLNDEVLKLYAGHSSNEVVQVASGVVTVAGSIKIADAGNIGSASDADAIAISSGGVVTMNQIPVFSAGINVSGGTIAGTLATAAQTAITSVGTLTALQVDNININGNAITSTAGTDLTITPLAGQQIVLDGTIVIDAGVVTGATSITSTAFVGDITGDVTGNADTFTATANNSANETVYPVFVDGATGTQGAETDTGLTYNPSTGLLTSTGFSGNLTGTLQTAAQGNVTSLGTLTTLTVDNIIINGTTIGHTSDTDAISISSGGDVTLTKNLIINAQGDIRFADSDSSHYVAFQAANTIASNITWTLPAADGDEDQVLSTNGSGTLAWADAGSGGSSSGSSYPNSTVSTMPGSAGNYDLGKNTAQDTAETPFEAGGADAFGVNLGTVYSMMDPAGTTTTVDLGTM